VVVGTVGQEVVVDEAPLVVVTTGHPNGPQVSQQLAWRPTVPPIAAQRSASPTTVHPGPSSRVRQHVTKPGRPQVDRAAQRTTLARQWRGRVPFRTASLATPATHRTQLVCVVAAAQGQLVSAAFRVAATAVGSAQPAANVTRAIPGSDDASRRRHVARSMSRPPLCPWTYRGSGSRPYRAHFGDVNRGHRRELHGDGARSSGMSARRAAAAMVARWR